MKYTIKKTKEKEPSTYKTLYIKESLVQQLEKIAKEHHTSWNNVVISMIESCLSDDEEPG